MPQLDKGAHSNEDLAKSKKIEFFKKKKWGTNIEKGKIKTLNVTEKVHSTSINWVPNRTKYCLFQPLWIQQ